MRVVVAALLSLLPCSQAAALSCNEYDFDETYWQHMDAPDTYLLVYGGFSNLRDLRRDKANDRVVWRATFTGMKASARSFDQPFSAPVTVTVDLYSQVFEKAPDPQEMTEHLLNGTGLVFLQEAADGLAISTGLCDPAIDTDPENVRLALRCLNNRHCPRPRQ
jgi:hypothetical protein